MRIRPDPHTHVHSSGSKPVLIWVWSVVKMAAGWTADETKGLIGIWGEEEVQNALDGVVRNKTIYQKIAAARARLGNAKSWQQCRTKVRNC